MLNQEQFAVLREGDPRHKALVAERIVEDAFYDSGYDPEEQRELVDLLARKFRQMADEWFDYGQEYGEIESRHSHEVGYAEGYADALGEAASELRRRKVKRDLVDAIQEL